MRFKTLQEPTGIVKKGDEWLSPEGHSTSFRRVFNGVNWDDSTSPTGIWPVVEPPAVEIDTDEDDETDEDTDDTTDEESEDENSTTDDEETTDEQSVSTKVSDSDGSEQGSGGQSEPEQEQRGKRGKVRKGRKGK
jgi:hypothetical protein